MKRFWFIVLVLLLFAHGLMAQDLDSRVSVLESRIETLCQNTSVLANEAVTKDDFAVLKTHLDKIESMLNPKMEKVVVMDAWIGEHKRFHERASDKTNKVIAITVSVMSLMFVGLQLLLQYIDPFRSVKRRGGNGA